MPTRILKGKVTPSATPKDSAGLACGTATRIAATLFYNLYLYQNAFRYFDMGYASTLAWILFIIVLLLTLLIFRSSDMWVYYEGQLRGKS